MRLLLDTHAFLWIVAGDSRLNDRARDAFLDANNEIFLSVVSFWEVGTKISLGRIDLAPGWPQAFKEEMEAGAIGCLAPNSRTASPYPAYRSTGCWSPRRSWKTSPSAAETSSCAATMSTRSGDRYRRPGSSVPSFRCGSNLGRRRALLTSPGLGQVALPVGLRETLRVAVAAPDPSSAVPVTITSPRPNAPSGLRSSAVWKRWRW